MSATETEAVLEDTTLFEDKPILPALFTKFHIEFLLLSWVYVRRVFYSNFSRSVDASYFPVSSSFFTLISFLNSANSFFIAFVSNPKFASIYASLTFSKSFFLYSISSCSSCFCLAFKSEQALSNFS